MKVYIPIQLPSLANLSHIHWWKLAAMARQQKLATRLLLVGKDIPPMPVVVIITRIGPRKLDDDNLASACKYVRDQIAATIGVDDGSDLYTWICKQKTGGYGVDVEIISR